MQEIWVLLTRWRCAERQRDDLPVDSPEWQLAVEEVEHALALYRAELAQATARHREAEIADHRGWWSPAPVSRCAPRA